jgi:hypothetical protein
MLALLYHSILSFSNGSIDNRSCLCYNYLIMKPEILGVPLSSYQEPIRAALQRYSEESNETLEFDLDSASELTLTPEKPNSARSESLFKQLGEVAGTHSRSPSGSRINLGRAVQSLSRSDLGRDPNPSPLKSFVPCM